MLLKLCKGAGGVFGEVGRDWVRSQRVKSLAFISGLRKSRRKKK